jgi:2-dehydro-3-deoxyphosphooctonate aldolase (KDO 8-P synthase)
METDIGTFFSHSESNSLPLFILGPCQIESETDLMHQAESLLKAVHDLPIRVLFKSSFDKANRTSLTSSRGSGLESGLLLLEKVKKTFGLSITTDIHLPQHAKPVSEVVDVLQIPAFLCRQTDLLVAAGETGKPVNIKKGQFLHPLDMLRAAEKVSAAGSKKIMLCERGTSFGYRELVVDMRSFAMLHDAMDKEQISYPLIFDATHSTQSIGGKGGASNGNWKMALPLAYASIAAGAQGIFAECHTAPSSASSDQEAMIPMKCIRDYVQNCLDFFAVYGRLRFLESDS